MLLAFVTLIVLPPIAHHSFGGVLLMDFVYAFVVLLSALYTSRTYREMIFMLVLGGINIAIFSLNSEHVFHNESTSLVALNALLNLLFFSHVFVNILRHMLLAKTITVNEVFACTVGYMVLGVLAAPCFFFIEFYFEGAFTIENPEFFHLLYYSYITLTTIGFGDISPVHPVAQSFTLILGIFGQLYLTVLIGVIISKFVSSN